MQISSTGGSHQENLPTVAQAPINKQGLRGKTQPLEEILSEKPGSLGRLLMWGHEDRQ